MKTLLLEGCECMRYYSFILVTEKEAKSMSHERGQRTPGTPGKDATANASNSPTKKKMEYMTGVMPPGIKMIHFELACTLRSIQ